MPAFARVYTGPDGKSHIEEIDPPFQPFRDVEGSWGQGTPLQAAAAITFRRSPPGYVLEWHNAPRRQYTITLQGQVEIEASDGTRRRFGPGSVLLAEDLDGEGHTTRVVGTEERVYVVVPLAE